MKYLNVFLFAATVVGLSLVNSCDLIEDIVDTKNTVETGAGLIAYYKFNDKTANNTVSQDMNGNLNGNPQSLFIMDTPDGTGYAVSLASYEEEQYMTLPYNPFKEIKTYSVSFWVKEFTVGSFIKSDRYFDFEYTDESKLRLNVYNSDSFTYEARQLQEDGRWHMLTVVADVNKMTLYVDGKPVSSLSEGIRTAYGEELVIRNKMKFDNLRIYNRALNDDVVKEIYNLEKLPI